MYKLYDKATQKYHKGGGNWNDKGKIYHQISHLRTYLTQVARSKLDMVKYKLAQQILAEHNIAYGTAEYWKNRNKILNENPEYKRLDTLSHGKLTKEMRSALYAEFLPDTWEIVKIGEVIIVNERIDL